MVYVAQSLQPHYEKVSMSRDVDWKKGAVKIVKYKKIIYVGVDFLRAPLKMETAARSFFSGQNTKSWHL